MLVHLTIHNLVLIEQLEVSFEEGFSVLTGETGAGKSILLDALDFSLGRRGDSALIRKGAEQLSVTAEFNILPTHPLVELLQENDIPLDPPSLIFRRTLNQQGRSRAFINDQSVSIGLLKTLGAQILEIHGQFDRLLESASHPFLLDKFSSNAELRQQVGLAYNSWQKTVQELKKRQEAVASAALRAKELEEALAELRPLNLRPGEEDELLKEQQTFSHQSKIVGALEQACSLAHPMLSNLAISQRALEKISDLIDVQSSLSALGRAEIEIKEALHDLESNRRSLDFNPRRREEVEERLHLIRVLARKYKVPADELSALADALERELGELEDQPLLLKQGAIDVQESLSQYKQIAESLRHRRLEAASILDERVSDMLPSLKLEQALFQTEILLKREEAWSAEGIDSVEFKFAANKGQTPQSLTKVASGGERSRLMLILKQLLAKHHAVSTIIFDEIDSGAGGAVASAMGKCLKELSSHLQVLSVTHSPQVAAWADRHYKVMKQDVGTEMQTHLKLLDEDAKQEELARMLSGSEITAEARAAAQKLRA